MTRIDTIMIMAATIYAARKTSSNTSAMRVAADDAVSLAEEVERVLDKSVKASHDQHVTDVQSQPVR